MDEFGLDRPELTGSVISMEFGPGGRIQQLWASDPSTPEEGEEFQFIAPPLNMGEEMTEDYFPGTILLGARTHPEDPWILSRNSSAEPTGDDDETSVVGFDYDFSFIEELQGTGSFYEIPGVVPQIAWDFKLRNRSRRSVEIGELAFPFALNNVYEGFPKTDKGLRELWNDRVCVHKFIGGAASYLYAQRLTARPPGLLIFPGENTRWEFYNHVPASLVTPYRWEGIPMVYVHSRAAIEREGWPEWFGGHTSTILEPGEERTYQIRFAPAERGPIDHANTALAACGRPAIRLVPSAVVPADVGIAIEVQGTTPTRFFTDIDTELETDADEDGGFCFIRPSVTGPLKVSFEDTQGRESEIHLFFTAPIADLISKRAEWIAEHQFITAPGALHHAIVPADNRQTTALTDAETFMTGFGIESGLSDALFLAEKNTRYPDPSQISVLDCYVTDFLEDDVRNPADGSVGSLLPDFKSVALGYGSPRVYPLTFCLYHALAKIARTYGGLSGTELDYLKKGYQTALAMFKHVDPAVFVGAGQPLMPFLFELLTDLKRHGVDVSAVQRLADARAIDFSRRRYPFSGESLWSTSGFEEVYDAARRRQNEELEERTLRCAYATRSLSPSWWWYGVDKRSLEDTESSAGIWQTDRGELCIGPSTVANSLMFLQTLERDTQGIPDAYLRQATGGLFSPWALVREDGAAGMGFGPDSASGHVGISGTTGDIGLSLFYYLHAMSSYVLPTRGVGVLTVGCHFETDTENDSDWYSVKPWDGVGRRIVVRQVGLDVATSFGVIKEFRFDGRKRRASLVIYNPADRKMPCTVIVRGLWGVKFSVDGIEVPCIDGVTQFSIDLLAQQETRTEIEETDLPKPAEPASAGDSPS